MGDKLNCNSCGNEIDFKMKHSIKTNHCPFCGDTMLTTQQHVSLVELDRVLKNESFAEDETLDLQIKEKVSLLLTKHFDFTMTSMPKDQKPRQLENQTETSPSPKKESPLKAKLEQARALYAKVQSEIDEPIDLDMPYDEESEEVTSFEGEGSFLNVFGQQTAAEKAAQHTIESMKQKRQAQSSGSGIKRLS